MRWPYGMLISRGTVNRICKNKSKINREWVMKLLDRARVRVRFCSHFSLSPSFLVLECSSFAIALLVIFRRKKRPTMYCLHSCLHINSCTSVNSDKETSDAEVKANRTESHSLQRSSYYARKVWRDFTGKPIWICCERWLVRNKRKAFLEENRTE